MRQFEREQLLGYLLGTLDEDEAAHLEARLHAEPDLGDRLSAMAQRIEPLEELRAPADPPEGLAERTLDYVFDRQPAAATPALSAAVEPSPGWFSRMSWGDLTVAAALMVAASAMVFPALQSSRFNARLQQCQDNLRQIGVALMQYSDQQGGYLPFVPREGKLASAGVYAPVLFAQGLLERDGQVVCPDSPLAERSDFHVPRLERIEQAATPVELAALRRDMGGSYGYSLGHIEDGVYQGTRDLRRPHFALVADRPDPSQEDFRTLHHGRRGQNVLFEDGHADFRATPASLDSRDRFFVNDQGRIGPGMHRDDSVIVSSTADPMLATP